MQALGRSLRQVLLTNARLGETACRVTTSAATEAPAAAAASTKGPVSREFQVQSFLLKLARLFVVSLLGGFLYPSLLRFTVLLVTDIQMGSRS